MSVQKRESVVSMHYACIVITAGLLFANADKVEASNLNFLKDTPMSYIKKPDMDSLKGALLDTLNTKSEGESSRWINEGTGNVVPITATMKPEHTSHEGERTCRRIGIVLSAKGQSMDLHPEFCGTGKTDWTLKKR